MKCEARVWLAGESVEFVYHAIERYRERVRPELDHFHAAEACRRHAQKDGVILHHRPPGVALGLNPRDEILTVAWLLAGDYVSYPLCQKPGGYVATTCITIGKGSCGHHA